MSEITPEMVRDSSQKIMNTILKWTEGMHDLDRIFRTYNEAIKDAVSFVEVMAQENPQHRMTFNILATKMRKELPLMRIEEN